MTVDEYFRNGWKAEKITAGAAETKTVHAGRCLLGRLAVATAVITVTPKDDATELAEAQTNAAVLNIGLTPIRIETSLKLTFSGAGDAWVIYKVV